jgi:hypothetical protein
MEDALDEYTRYQDMQGTEAPPEEKLAIELFFICFALCFFTAAFVGHAVYRFAHEEVQVATPLDD